MLLSLFNGRPVDSESSPPRADVAPLFCAPPKLLLDLTPWHREFIGNLLDLLLLRRQPPQHLTSQPSAFWPDVFVNRKLPARPFWQSGLYHIFIIVAFYGISQVWLIRPPRTTTVSAFEHSTITYYKVSEYLPPIIPAQGEPAKIASKGDPVYAKQNIVSIRPNAQSRTQTIVSPPNINLPQDVRVPNIVAWNPVPPPVPSSAMSVRSSKLLSSPSLVVPAAPAIERSTRPVPLNSAIDVVPPAPVVDTAKLRVPPDILARTVVPPSPAVERSRLSASNLPRPSAIEPPVSAKNLPSRMGDINVASISVVPPAPKLPIAKQRASGSLMPGSDLTAVAPSPSTQGMPATQPVRAIRTGQATAVAPPPPSIPAPGGGGMGNQAGSGSLIALGIHPSAISGPINVPPGNRSGTFAAGPNGRPTGTGVPEIKGGGTGNGTVGSGASASGDGPHGPAGIYVERGPSTPSDAVVVSPAPQSAQLPRHSPLLASLAHPSVADLARGTRNQPLPSAPSSGIEREVFGTKKFYSMVLNMPNLSSMGGSWVVRFAELNASSQKGELSAPVAMRKVDPAYPSDLMRDRVEGTIVLYAIIHADGTVGDVRVLHGVDSRLDASARAALAKWQFRPATKNGTAVDLEAVVKIPFVAKATF